MVSMLRYFMSKPTWNRKDEIFLLRTKQPQSPKTLFYSTFRLTREAIIMNKWNKWQASSGINKNCYTTYFFNFCPVWVFQFHYKPVANTSKYAWRKNFFYNTSLVDVTLAVCEFSQKSCSNVNISAYAVPKGFLAKVKISMISMELPFHEMLFFHISVAKFLAHKRNKLKQIKTFAMFIAWKVALEC